MPASPSSFVVPTLSLTGHVLRPGIKALVQRGLALPGAKAKRDRLQILQKLMLVPRIARRNETIGGVPCECMGPADAPVVLYLHGGGYMVGSPASHRAITARFAQQGGFRVVVPDYRLAPEHPFPAAIEDAVAVYRTLLDSGVAPSRIAVGGDSAGGHLTLSLALQAKAQGLPQPAALVMYSPWVDAQLRGESFKTREREEIVLSNPLIAEFRAAFLPGDVWRSPAASPIDADLSGLAPMLIQVGGAELLFSDAQQLAARARSAGVEVTLQEWRQAWHVWQLYAGALPEANRAIALSVQFLLGHLNCNTP